MRKVFLDDLPHKGKLIDWQNSAGCKVNFIYDDIKGFVTIINYDREYIYIKYSDKDVFKILTGCFANCKLGRLLEKNTKNFKLNIGETFKDDKRDLCIIDREYRKDIKNKWNMKWYKYHCNNCNCERWITEYDLLRGNGCSVCCKSPQTIVEGVNDIPTTDPWMVKFFQGGYDEAKLYNKSSGKKIFPICPDCGKIKDKPMLISSIFKQKSIGCFCSDKQSYPNKLMFNVLNQLGIEFIAEFSPDWIKPKRYDFYFELNNKKYIIEMDGNFHFVDNKMNGQTKEQSKEFDNYKELKAIENSIDVIRIDSQKSNLEYIKNNIISKLSSFLDISDIDWHKCEEFALANLVRVACDYKENNNYMTTKEIGKIMKLSNTTIIEYLKKGNKLGWCKYNPKEESFRGESKSGKMNGKIVGIFKDDILLDKFPSCAELERKSKSVFGVRLTNQMISEACNKNKQYKGYCFKYINNENQLHINEAS